LAGIEECPHRVALKSWLAKVKDQWESEVMEHLGMEENICFNFEPAQPKPLTTPVKRKAAAPAERGSAVKAIRVDVAAATPDVERWLHQMDGELERWQASEVQIKCEGGGKKRALVLSGAYPLKACGFALAEAFGVMECGPAGVRSAIRK
jgi:hypothetical protein